MINFIIGLFFVFINFQLDIKLVPGTIEILPSFIGYLFIFRGITQYSKKYDSFDDIKALSLAMALYSLAIFVLHLMNLDYTMNSPIIQLTNSIVFQKLLPLFIVYKIVWGTIDISEKENVEINEDALKMIFIYTALVSILTFFLDDSVLLLVIQGVSLILNMVLLYNLYSVCQAHTKKLSQNNQPTRV